MGPPAICGGAPRAERGTRAVCAWMEVTAGRGLIVGTRDKALKPEPEEAKEGLAG